ncbi:hypothetical protein H2200_000981 [Cladophialophora chaetospira]|uniref:Zn(2)-C6 fungal-type domain-containing protein n=1 Tax=Cladophialophora chaetospira TaxID=386627 RepID=A0AA39CQV8_9EURO|nr:hypothetical protein H2200_000981 [Cladophialophora chaetospira]
MSTDHMPSQHEFALSNTQTVTKGAAHLSGARDARIKTACAECKRRKTKCDGTHPCYSCRWYKQPERCIYTLTRPALILSRKNFESVRQRLEAVTDVLSKLFPEPSIEALGDLSREELLERLASTSGAKIADQQIAPNDHHSLITDSSLPVVTNASNPRLDPSERVREDSDTAQPESESSDAGDDVNALSSAQTSSYVGPTSTMQMFRTILRIAPEPFSRQQSSQSPATRQQSGSLRSPETTYRTTPSLKMTERTSALIDSYFYWVHPATPILDENDFRNTAISGVRNDPPWLCLLNMVLAMGSIGMTRTDSKEHLTYYHAAKSHLDLEGLGNKSFEYLQALILMAGWYNHYRNRPNLASALLGAAFRMAYALGLHKELHNNPQSNEHQELRRMIWWNLVVFDAAEAVTLARTLDTKIFESEVHHPREMMTDFVDSPSTASALVITIGFSRIMTEIQSRLMTATPIPFTESLSLDAHLVDWYESLPIYFHSLVGAAPVDVPPHKRFVQPFMTIKWRYLNLRMLLYRPSLMEAVLYRTPFSELTSDQRLCIRKCLTLSGETIDSVKLRSSEPPNQYISWPSTWYLLQISMVPLLTLYVFKVNTNEEGLRASLPNPHMNFKHSSAGDQVRQIRDECHKQVQSTLRLMKEMEPWAVASGKMHDLISHLHKSRDQQLRIWNNTEESPALVFGSPENTSARPMQQALPEAPDTDRANTSDKPVGRSGHAPPPEYMQGPPEINMNAITVPRPFVINGAYQNPTSQFDPSSRDWAMYSNFNWPNATLESLFDLPDEFQYISEDPFGIG